MKCPKCKSNHMLETNSLSRCSPLAPCDVTNPVVGKLCHICGKWEESEFIPVCPMPPIKKRKEKVKCCTSESTPASPEE